MSPVPPRGGAGGQWEHAHLEALAFMRDASAYDDSKALEAHFLKVLHAFGFDRYCCIRTDGQIRGHHPAVLSSRDIAEWDQYWMERGYDAVDPVGHLALTGAASFTWTQARDIAKKKNGGVPKGEQKLFGEAREAGMGDGLIARALGPGGETLIVRMMTPADLIRPADRPLLDAVAIIFSTMQLRLHERDGDQPTEGLLTVREQQCLRWASGGLIDAEISDQLHISMKTVAFHMENAKRKLGAKTRLAAYRRAQEMGLLGPVVGGAEG